MTPEQARALFEMREIAKDVEKLYEAKLTRSSRWTAFGNIKDRLFNTYTIVSSELDKVFAKAVHNENV
jgi:hypothetical protein